MSIVVPRLEHTLLMRRFGLLGIPEAAKRRAPAFQKWCQRKASVRVGLPGEFVGKVLESLQRNEECNELGV